MPSANEVIQGIIRRLNAHKSRHNKDGADPITKIELTEAEPLTLSGDGLVYMELRPDIDFESVRALGVPNWVTRGVFGGFSLPVFGDDGEEIRAEIHAPKRWDGASNIPAHVRCYLDTANTDKKFQMELAWEKYTTGDTLKSTAATAVHEIDTGTAEQYKSFEATFDLDYDKDTPDNLQPSDNIGLRLRRIAASTAEISGEVVVQHLGLVFRRDKLGSTVA